MFPVPVIPTIRGGMRYDHRDGLLRPPRAHTHTHTPSNAVYRLQGERQPVASIGMDRSIHSTRWRLIEGPLDRVRFFADSWSAAFN